MKNVKRLAALLLALVLLMTPIISVQAKETIGTAQDKTLYYFDLERFLNEAENDKVHYDYLKLASALQGLANRDVPRLYFRYYDMEETDFAMEHLTDHVEQWWLKEITDKSNGYGKLKDGGDLADYKIVEVKEYWNLFSLFKDCYEGIVLWDENAPATANVASTIAGVENLLPVRLSNGEEDVYIQMLKHGFSTADVKRSLCGMFKGTGYIPTLGSSVPGAKMEYTTTPSTQSVKTDPYLWAKMFYLDTGLTNPTMMSFAIDGGSWEYQRSNAVENPKNKNRGELVSASIPDRMRPGERREVSFTYENIGESEWTWANFDRLAISTDGIPVDGDDFDFYVNADTDDGYTSNRDRLFLGQREQINPGQQAQFKGYLQAPKTQGTYKVQFIMWNDLEGPISVPLKHTIEVTPDARPDPGPQVPAYHPLEKTRYEDAEFDAEIIMAGIPAVVEPNESVTAKVAVRNIGTSAWKSGEVSLACGTQSVPLAVDTASGKTANFVVNFTAPSAEGDFTLTLQMKNGSSNMGDAYECKLKAEKPETVADYDCEVVSVKYEKGLEVGAKSASYVEVVNTGSKTWTLADGIKLVEAHGEQYMSTTAHDDDAGALLCELAMEDGVEVKPGEHYFFHFDLHSYTNTGAGKLYLEPESILDLELQITGKNGAFGDAASINLITYEQCQWPVKTFAEANDVPMSSKDRDATILWASVPKSIEAGTTEPFCVAIKNTGSIAWTRHVGLAEYNMVNLGINSGTMRFATAADGTNADSGDKNRLRIPYGLTVQPGEVLVMSGYLLAPEGTLAGTYDYDLHCVVDSATAGVGGKVGGPRAFSIAVTNLAAQADLAQAQALEASLTANRQEKYMTSALPEVLEDVSQQTVSFTQKVKNADEKALVATLVKDTVPNEMEPGQTLWVDLTFRNDGTSVLYGAQETGANLYIEILDQPNSKDYTNNFRLSRRADPMDSAAVLGNYFWQDRLGTATNPGIAVGAEGKIGFYLVAPKTAGVYTLKLGLPTSNKSTAYNKYYYEKQIFVGKTGFDTVTKDASETEFVANLIADNFPDKMTVGENKAFSATFANTGTATWLSKDIGWNFQMQQLDHTTGTDRSSNFIFSRRPDPTAAGADAGSYFYQGGSSSVAPGGQWTLNGYLHAPMTPGVYTLKFGVTTGPSAGGWYKYAFEKTIIVESGKNSEMTQVVRNASEAAYIATLIDENVPDQMEAGSAVQMAWKFRNDGTAAWGGYNNADAVKFNFVLEILDQADGTSRTNTFRLSRGQDAQKNWRNVGNWFWPNVCGQTKGQTLALDGYLLAPTTPGIYTLKIGVATSMKADRQNYKFSYEKEIVVGEASASMATKTKDSSEAAFAAELIADSIPDAMQVGENKMVRLSLRNIGTATWKSLDYGKAVCNNQLVLVGEKNNIDRTNGFRFSRNEAFTNSPGNYFHMGGKKECAPGRIWNYDLWLHAPTTEGYYTLKIGLDTRETDGGWYTYYFEKTIKVGNPTTQPEESTETEIKDPSQVPVGTNAYDGVIVSADMPENMLPGELTPVSITVKNTGTNTWYGFIGGSSRAMRLSAENAQGFGFYTDADGTKTGTSGAGHIDIPTGVAVVSGDTYTFTAYLKAPAARGIYALKMVPYSGAGGWHTAGGHTFDIRVSKTGGTYTPTEPTYTSDRRDAEVVVSSIPTAVETGTQSQIAVWMKNNGQETWTPGTDIDGYFLRYKIAGRTAGYAPVAETIEPGEKTHLTLRYDAPNREDNYSVQVQMVYLSKGSYKPFGDKVSLRADTDNSLGVKNAEILSVTAPEEMPEGTKGEVAVEVLNTGSMTWDSNVGLAEQGTNAYMSKTGTEGDKDQLLSAVTIEPGVEVAAGERYIFHFDLHTWTNAGTRMIYEAPGTTISQKLRMAALEGEHAGTFGDEFEIGALVTQIPVESELTVYADPDDVEMSGQSRSYEIISASVPTQMNGSQIAPITFTVKNTGNTAWVKHDGQFALHKMRLAMVSEGKEFGLYTDLNGVTYHSGDRNRIDLQPGETVMPGEVYTFNVYLKAPAYTGSYKIELYLTADGVGPEFSTQVRGDYKTYTILVDGTVRKGEDIYTNAGIMYQDAKNDSFTYSQLVNADLYIAEKAFFFDLWIDDTATPIDDRWQPLGTDERVLREVLNSQRKRAQAYEEGKDPWNKITGELGTGTFVVDGFPPWWLKYSGISDPESSYADSASEQLFVDFIGEYGGWMDADAAGTVSLANCSVFSKLELKVDEYAKKITQTQPEFDKSVGDPNVVYDPNTSYIVFFMGDWDGGAWNGNRMHAVYNDPRRGEIPVVWPIASGLSYRIPHVYNMMYDRATPNDFFAASDNGIGYLSWNYMADPRTEKSGITKAEGLEIHNDFVDLSKDLYEIFDLDIMTWYILCGHPDGLTQKAKEALATLHPYGVVTNLLVDPYVREDGTQTLFHVYNGWASNLGTEQMKIDAAARLAAYIKFDRQFLWLRSVKANVGRICETLEIMDKQNPGLNYKVVDPYTYFRLMKEADGGRSAGAKHAYTAPKAKTVAIDGKASKGEWDGAAEMVISPTSEEISKHGFNWAPSNLQTEDDLKSVYKIKWDEQNLYILEERIDNDVKFADPAVNSMQWLVDGSGIYLDTDDDDNTYFAGDFAVLFNRMQDGKPSVWLRSGQAGGGVVQRKLEPHEFKAAITAGENGNYTYELAINWSVVTSGFRPSANTEVGMTMLALDGDMAYSNTRQIMWHGNGDSQANWGILKFSN